MKNRTLIIMGSALLVGALAFPSCQTPFFHDTGAELTELRLELEELASSVESGDAKLDEAGRLALERLREAVKALEERASREAGAIPGRVPGALVDGWGAFQAGGAGAGLIALIVGLFKPSRREQDQQIEVAKGAIMEERSKSRQALIDKVADLQAQIALLQPSPVHFPNNLSGGAFPSSRPPSQV